MIPIVCASAFICSIASTNVAALAETRQRRAQQVMVCNSFSPILLR